MQFPTLIFCQNYERTAQIQISFKLHSFIVSIVCFYSCKLIIRPTFCMNLCDIYLKGLLFQSEVVFTCFFDMKLSFFLVVG